jgi:hypothetical protein
MRIFGCFLVLGACGRIAFSPIDPDSGVGSDASIGAGNVVQTVPLGSTSGSFNGVAGSVAWNGELFGVIWTSPVNASLWYTGYSPTGEVVVQPRDLGIAAYGPSIAAVGRDLAIAAYALNEARYVRIDRDGNVLASQQVSDPTHRAQHPRIHITGGRACMVWADATTPPHAVYARWLDLTGAPTGVQLAVGSSYNWGGPWIGCEGTRMHVLWVGANNRTYYRVFEGDQPLIPETVVDLRVANATLATADQMAVTGIDASDVWRFTLVPPAQTTHTALANIPLGVGPLRATTGGFVMAWYGQLEDLVWRIFVSRLASDGTSVTSPIYIDHKNPDFVGALDIISLAGAAPGAVAAIWIENDFFTETNGFITFFDVP